MDAHLNEAVVFVLIGWNDTYDGTTRIVGGHKYLKANPTNNSEMRALVRDSDGYFHCGAGRGALKEKMVTAVLVARHPISLSYEAVAIYHNALPRVGKDQWATVSAQRITVFPINGRPTFNDWPAGQGMRRWAHRNLRGPAHSRLLSTYKRILNAVGTRVGERDSDDYELSGFEGSLRARFKTHRQREGRLRAEKINQALVKGNGRLKCEVPGCRFEFMTVYGEIGRNFAHVHHKLPLASGRRRTTLDDLVIVCANCHAMIHRDGGCRDFRTLIKGPR
ncbi:HNH endonuclease [Luteibacter sp. PPL201]|uniref:HNH endonuclease n=1 Tax=Luteibacter sahnii TaxID=3021977 RepID=A0ABT6BDT0_9GAMM|nr:HNH endonuclease [Luteibacter sp. PPL193]MDY1548876.1 HNH endonuclease [Luteibacter sp. PPL193]